MLTRRRSELTACLRVAGRRTRNAQRLTPGGPFSWTQTGRRNVEMAERIARTPVRYPFSFVFAGDSGAWPDRTADAVFAQFVRQTGALDPAPVFFANLGDFAGPGTGAPSRLRPAGRAARDPRCLRHRQPRSRRPARPHRMGSRSWPDQLRLLPWANPLRRHRQRAGSGRRARRELRGADGGSARSRARVPR